jgi:hypothetical protein
MVRSYRLTAFMIDRIMNEFSKNCYALRGEKDNLSTMAKTHVWRQNLNALWRARRALLAWAVRIIIIGLAYGSLVPPAAQVTLGVPQSVQTTKPQLCVHTRLMDEVDEWKIQRSLQLVREMGATHIVEFFPWAYVEGQRGQYDWASVDRVMRHAENQGMQVIARVGYVPAWAQADLELTTLNTLPPAAYPDFAEFVAAFAARYSEVAHQIIIWNEPNLAFEWGFQSVDPAGYVRLLQAVYPVAHAANPNVQILLAGLAPTLEPAGSAAALNDLTYLEAVYAAGGGAFFDGVALHSYGFNLPASDLPAPDRLNFRRAELLYAVMARNGDGDKPVYLTETGWNDAPNWSYAVTPSERARYTLEGLALAETWAWLDQTCLWMFRTPAPIGSHQDGYTMVTPQFQLKAIYYAVQRYARGDTEGTDLWLPAPTR